MKGRAIFHTSRVAVLSVLLLISLSANSDWEYKATLDDSGALDAVFASNIHETEFGIALHCDTRELLIQFYGITPIGDPGSDFTALMIVDDSSIYRFSGTVDNDSKRHGHVVVDSMEEKAAVRDLMHGRFLSIHLENDPHGASAGSIRLDTFPHGAIKYLLECDNFPGVNYTGKDVVKESLFRQMHDQNVAELQSQEAGPAELNNQEKTNVEQRKLASLKNLYLKSMRQRVERYWRKPPGFSGDVNCTVSLLQSVVGEVLKVAVEECEGGNAALRKSVENAVRDASPLPAAPDPKLFDTRVKFYFRPD